MRLAGLDSIRFICALLVVLGHFGGPPFFTDLDESVLVSRVIKALFVCLFNGPAAVIVFFIISGVVIHYPYANGKALSFPQFYINRYIRLGVPMGVIALIAVATDRIEVTGVFWSLYAEIIYYTLYPVILILKKKYGIKSLILITYLIGLLLILTVPFKKTNNYVDLGNYFTWIIGLPCWMLGVYLAENITVKTVAPVKKIVFYRFGIFSISVLLRIIKFHTEISNLFSLNLFALVVFFWLREEINYYRAHSSVRILEWAGTWSYSLYICHLLVLSFLPIIFPNFPLMQWFVLLTSSLLASYAFYLTVEKPSHFLAKHKKLHLVKNLQFDARFQSAPTLLVVLVKSLFR